MRLQTLAKGLYVTALLTTSTYMMLDTFVIERIGNSGTILPSLSSSETSSSSELTSSMITSEIPSSIPPSSEALIEPTFTEFGYIDNEMELNIEVIRRAETQVYVAILKTQNISAIRSAFAGDVYGKNIREKTSVMAERNNAIFAINGDYYGFRDIGYVIRNGLTYRLTPRPGSADNALLLSENGSMIKIDEASISIEALTALQPWQVWSFGPLLINQGQLRVDETSKVPYELASNPRTAIGQLDHQTFIFVVSDGRTSESAGLSLLELAEVFVEYGASFAYNLDGGGSATMWFNGRLINKPTNSGSTISERSISDCVYIGYE